MISVYENNKTELKVQVVKELAVALDTTSSYLIDGLKYTFIFLLIIVITIALVNFISIKLFIVMTKNVSEFEEISKNNIAVSILTATIIICISLLVKDSVYLLIDSFVPYPETPRFN